MKKVNQSLASSQVRMAEARARAEVRRRVAIQRYQADLEAERGLIASIEAAQRGTPAAAALPICALVGFSTRAQTFLKTKGCETVGDVAHLSTQELSDTPRLGWDTIHDIEKALQKWGFKLKK